MPKVTSKLQLTVPKKIADQYGIRPGDELEWIPAGDSIRVELVRRKAKAGQLLTAEERVALFDAGMARVDKLQSAELKANQGKPAPRDRGWTREDLVTLTPPLARLGVALIEQPLKADDDSFLAGFQSPVPLCADESCHIRADLPRLTGRYSHINIKLDKAGGLTEALALAREAQSRGLHLMVGCMVSTSLAMAPASLLAGMAEFTDLDGPLLLAHDREPGMTYEGDLLYPAARELWG